MTDIAKIWIIGAVAVAAAGYAFASRAQENFEGSEVRPRYRVEIILFGYQDFDPNEELLTPRHLESVAGRNTQIPQQRYLDALTRLEILRQVDAPILISGPPPPELLPFPNDVLALASFSPDGRPQLEFRILEPGELELNSAYSRITRLSAYRPLVHGGWVQDAMSEDEAIAFDIRRLSPLGVSGSIRLHVSRFLHVTVDLTYRPAPESEAFGRGGNPSVEGFGQLDPFAPARGALTEILLPPSYHLTAERRILRGELSYIDHPAFGLIVLITLEPTQEVPSDTGPEATRPAA